MCTCDFQWRIRSHLRKLKVNFADNDGHADDPDDNEDCINNSSSFEEAFARRLVESNEVRIFGIQKRVN